VSNSPPHSNTQGSYLYRSYRTAIQQILKGTGQKTVMSIRLRMYQTARRGIKFEPMIMLQNTEHVTYCTHCPLLTFRLKWAAIAQSVLQLVTESMDRGSNPGAERDFPHRSRPSLGPTKTPVTRVLVLLLGVKAAGAWRWSPTASNAEVKNEYRYICTLRLHNIF